MKAVDTNVLVRLLTRDDPEQVTRAEMFVDDGAWISHIVLAETVWVLESAYGVSREGIATAVGLLTEHRQLVLQDPDLVSAALDLFRQNRKTDFSDCLILETARRAGHQPLGTFERTLGVLHGAVLV